MNSPPKLAECEKSANCLISISIPSDLPWFLIKKAVFTFCRQFLKTCVLVQRRCEPQKEENHKDEENRKLLCNKLWYNWLTHERLKKVAPENYQICQLQCLNLCL